jgi:hypothetical protein
LKLEYVQTLSNFAFKFNLRRYNKALTVVGAVELGAAAGGRGANSHSSASQLNLSRFGH